MDSLSNTIYLYINGLFRRPRILGNLMKPPQVTPATVPAAPASARALALLALSAEPVAKRGF